MSEKVEDEEAVYRSTLDEIEARIRSRKRPLMDLDSAAAVRAVRDGADEPHAAAETISDVGTR